MQQVFLQNYIVAFVFEFCHPRDAKNLADDQFYLLNPEKRTLFKLELLQFSHKNASNFLIIPLKKTKLAKIRSFI